MKIKSLFWSLLACTALVACSNNDIIDEGENKPGTGELESVPAYISLSIATTTGSARGVDGDTDGDQEDSGHNNDGTAAENKVSNLAVIIKSLTPEGGDAENSGIASTIDTEHFQGTTVGGQTIYVIDQNFKVLAGKHKVLTIVNPTQAIQDAIISANAETGNEKYKAINALYNGLTDAKDQGLLSKFGTSAAPSKGSVLPSLGNALMFVNRDEVVVEATAKTSETSPAEAVVTLERTVAKMTYRQSKADDKYDITFNVTKQELTIVKKNEVNYILVKDAADRVRARKINESDNIVTEDEKNVDVTFGEEAIECYTYSKSGDGFVIGEKALIPHQLTDTDHDAIPENEYYLYKDEDGKWVAPELIYTPYTQKIKDWKVQLTSYAFINLINDSHVIRHTANGMGEDVKTFGLLNGSNYLADPYFADKNAASTDGKFADYGKWGTINNEEDRKTAETSWWTNWDKYANNWFNNTLKKVADETNGMATEPSFFTNLIHGDVVEDKGHNSEIGYPLQYCYENGVRSDMQMHGVTTGIVFKAALVPAGTTFNMYQYGTEVYTNLKDIYRAYASGNAAIKDLRDGKKEETAANIKAAGIKIYDNNECYYYTNQIKHFDNGDENVAGNMEFAIVRNNIYSLAVSSIQSIGDAAIDPNPGIDNESAVGYIQIKAQILPWAIRFNNIKF